MRILLWLLQLNFLPATAGFGLLLLRLSLGASMLALHGAAKLANYSALAASFPDPLGVGSRASLLLVILVEVTGSILIALGLFTRLAALAGMATMAVAFVLVHKGALSGPGSGELALLYFIAYTVLFIGGGGRLSLDTAVGSQSG